MDPMYKHDQQQQSFSRTPQLYPRECVQGQMPVLSREIPLTVPSPFSSPFFAGPSSQVQSNSSVPSSSSCSRADHKARKRMFKAQAKASKHEVHALAKEAKHQVKELKHEVKHQAREFKKEIRHQTKEALRTVRSNLPNDINGCTACPQQQLGLDQQSHHFQRGQCRNRRDFHQRRCRHHSSPHPIHLLGLSILAKVVERGLRLLGVSDSHRDCSPERPVILIAPPPLDNRPSAAPLMPLGAAPTQSQYLPPTGTAEKALGSQEPVLVYTMTNISLDNRASAQLSSASPATPSSSILTAVPQDPTSSFREDDEELDTSVPPPSYQASIAH